MPPEQKAVRKLRAILSADVKGYSLLMADDETFTIQTLKTYRNIMSEKIQQHGGRVVDSPGDNLLAEFSSAVDAVQCGVEIQRQLKIENARFVEDKRLQFRIGVNIGDVVQDGDRIYGSGVNVAARIEGLADPGGICISRNAYDHIKDKLQLGYEYLGQHEVKNIKDPVRVYKVLMAPEDVGKLIGDVPKPVAKNWIWATVVVAAVVITAVAFLVYQNMSKPEFEPASVEKMAYPLPGKPSIAVLPFDNMSGDPEQEYFSDGITEDIITTLSKIDDLFVIARNSTFTYKGKPVKIKQVAEELGVRYVLEGSVRKSEDRVRITAQLIDAVEGNHLWAERYDRDLRNIFDIQDEVTMKIVTSLQVNLTSGEQAYSGAARTKNIDIYLKHLEASSLGRKGTKESIIRLGQVAQQIIDMAPESSLGYGWMAWSNWNLAWWSQSPQEYIAKAFKLAKKTLSMDEYDAGTHALLGSIFLVMRQYETAIAEGERSVELEPNGAWAHGTLGNTLCYAGKIDEGIGHYKQSIRLSPFPLHWHHMNLGRCYRQKGLYEEALIEYKKALQQNPDFLFTHLSLAGIYALLDRQEEAEAEAKKVLEIDPSFSVERASKAWPYKNQADLKLFLDALNKAGLPDKPSQSLPDKPSIAILPFENMSGDPEQEYFSDGMTDELIGDLAKIKDIFVISRNSAFTYKGKSTKVQQIAKDLNVRYILEGSIQKSGNKVRIRAQLIDGKTDHHLWSESYDGEMDDIFELQDKITGKIVSALAIKLTEDEQDRISEKGTNNILAYEAFLKGYEHYAKFTGKNLQKAIEYYKQAIQLDPKFSRAYSALAAGYLMLTTQSFPKELGISPPEITTLRYKARQSLDLSMKDPTFESYRLASYMAALRRRFDDVIVFADKSLLMAPNEYLANLAMGSALCSLGRGNEALTYIDKAIQLDPRFLDVKLGTKGVAYFLLEDYEKAVESIQRCLTLNPGLTGYAAYAAASYAFLDRQNEAKRAWKIFEDGFIEGMAPTSSFLYWAFPFEDTKIFDHLVDGLVKAGFEGDPSDYNKVNKDNRLNGQAIRELLFGKIALGTIAGFEISINRSDTGEAELHIPMFGISDNGKSWIEGDMVCNQYNKTSDGVKFCQDVYINPEGNYNDRNQYLLVSDAPLFIPFSIKE